MGNAHHVGEGGGSVFPVALAEPFNDAEEAGSKFPGVGGDARDELGEAGQLVKGMELESPLEQWGVFLGLGLSSRGDGRSGGHGNRHSV